MSKTLNSYLPKEDREIANDHMKRWSTILLLENCKQNNNEAEQWHTPIIPTTLGRLMQEDHKLEASLSNLARSCLKITSKELGI